MALLGVVVLVGGFVVFVMAVLVVDGLVVHLVGSLMLRVVVVGELG